MWESSVSLKTNKNFWDVFEPYSWVVKSELCSFLMGAGFHMSVKSLILAKIMKAECQRMSCGLLIERDMEVFADE